jgi:hypothetical protein
VRQAFCRADPFGIVQLDALSFHELEKAFAVTAHFALHFGQRGKLFAFRLRDILSRDLRPSLCAPLGFRQ